MSNIHLFIENQEIELNESVQFAITKQFEDITNPTTIINDWSKTVSIPFSQKNNRIFGHIYDEDRLTATKIIPTDYMRTLTRSSVEAGTWDEQTGTLTSTRTTNTNPNSNTFKIYGWLNWNPVAILYTKESKGVGSYSFTYNPSSFNRLYIGFNGNNVDCGFYMELSDLTAGNSYTFSFNITELDRTDTGNNAKVTHLVLVEGSNVVTWDDIYKPTFTGIYFNPLRKLDFRLEWGNSVVMLGYAKMNEVKQISGKGTYEVTLFGELGKVFGEMKKITFDETTDTADYLIDGKQFVEEYIDKDLVADSWGVTSQSQSALIKKGQPNYQVTDIIGFCPNNSFTDGFDYKTAQISDTSSQLFTDILGDTFKEATGTNPDTAIPDGLLPREFGEYRSYLQLPFIYWNKLFQIFQNKAEEVTGYKFDLDSDWFNTSNPYWYNLVYMLKPLSTGNAEEISNTLNLSNTNEVLWRYNENYTNSKYIYFDYDGSTLPFVDTTTTPNNLLLTNEYLLTANSPLNFRLSWYRDYEDGRLYKGNALEISVLCRNVTDDSIVDEYKTLVCDEDYSGSTTDYYQVIRTKYSTPYTQSSTPMSKLEVTVIPSGIVLNKRLYGDVARVEVKAKFVNNSSAVADKTQESYIKPSAFHVNLISPTLNINQVSGLNKRSNTYFTLNTLWNNDYNLFEEILKYCKIYRIGITIDEYNKVISFIPYNKYFTNYNVIDWTEKVDKSKDFVITPITFDNKYVLFNYKDSDTNLGESYKEKYGVNYGEYRLTTSYNFNSDTAELFEDVTTSIVNTDNVLSWTNLKDNNKIVYSFPAEISVYNKDKDKKQVDIFGSYYFKDGLVNFSTETGLYMRPVYVTDDTIYQNANNSYFFIAANIEQNYRRRVYTYPKLDIVYSNNLCVFNVPKENYTYLNNYSDKASIYTNFWKEYLDERYNAQNKIITCYIDLTPIDWNNFKFNQLVKIGNQLCIVNKIYDYDITSNEPTKIDLITIQNINGYITNNYND